MTRKPHRAHLLAEGQEHHERLVTHLRRPLLVICAVLAALTGITLIFAEI